MTHKNGRFSDGDSPENSRDVFPIREDFEDFSGKRRWFEICMVRLQLGYSVSATEEGTRDGQGYFFREFDPISEYLALGRLRGRIQRALATRHLQERSPGEFQSLHNTLRGRISYASGTREVAFVIDGKFVTLTQFSKIAESYEGWEFRMEFLDSGDRDH